MTSPSEQFNQWMKLAADNPDMELPDLGLSARAMQAIACADLAMQESLYNNSHGKAPSMDELMYLCGFMAFRSMLVISLSEGGSKTVAQLREHLMEGAQVLMQTMLDEYLVKMLIGSAAIEKARHKMVTQ